MSLLHPPLQMPAVCLTEREVSVEHILFLFSFLYLALLKVSLQVGMFLKLAAAWWGTWNSNRGCGLKSLKGSQVLIKSLTFPLLLRNILPGWFLCSYHLNMTTWSVSVYCFKVLTTKQNYPQRVMTQVNVVFFSSCNVCFSVLPSKQPSFYSSFISLQWKYELLSFQADYRVW